MTTLKDNCYTWAVNTLPEIKRLLVCVKEPGPSMILVWKGNMYAFKIVGMDGVSDEDAMTHMDWHEQGSVIRIVRTLEHFQRLVEGIVRGGLPATISENMTVGKGKGAKGLESA